MGFPASVVDGYPTPALLIPSPTLLHRPDPSASEQSNRRLVTVVQGEGHIAGWPVCVPGGSELASTSVSSSAVISDPVFYATRVRLVPVGCATVAAAVAPASFAAPPTVPASDVYPVAPFGRRPSMTARIEATDAAGTLSCGDPLIGAFPVR